MQSTPNLKFHKIKRKMSSSSKTSFDKIEY